MKKENPATIHLTTLPEDPFGRIAEFLSHQDLLNLSSTNPELNNEFWNAQDSFIVSPKNIDGILNPQKFRGLKKVFKGTLIFQPHLDSEQINQVLNLVFKDRLNKEGSLPAIDFSRANLGIGQIKSILEKIPDKLRERIQINIGSINILREGDLAVTEGLLNLLDQFDCKYREEKFSSIDFSKSGLNASQIGNFLTTPAGTKLAKKGIIIDIPLNQDQNQYVTLINNREIKFDRISCNMEVQLDDALINSIFANSNSVDTSSLYLTQRQAQDRLDELKAQKRKIALKNPSRDFLRENSDIVGDFFRSDDSRRFEYRGTQDCPVQFYENGRVKSCAELKLYEIVDGQPVLREEYRGTKDCPVQFYENGRVKSCAEHKFYDIVNGQPFLHEEYRGTKDCPVQFYENGFVKSCSEHKFYQIFNGQLVLKYEYLGTKNCPVQIENGIVKSFAEHKIYKYEIVNDQPVLREEYRGTKDCPVQFDANDRVKSCTERKFYKIVNDQPVLSIELRGTQDCPVQFYENGVPKSCAESKFYQIVNGQPVLKKEYRGTKDCPIQIDENCRLKSCAEHKLYQIVNGQPVLKSELRGTKDCPVQFDKNGIVKSCAEFKSREFDYFGNCTFASTMIDTLTNPNQSRKGHPIKYDAYCRYGDKGEVGSLTIYLKDKTQIVFKKNKNNDELVLSEETKEIFRNKKLYKEAFSIIKPQDVKYESVLELKSRIEDLLLKPTTHLGQQSGLNLTSSNRKMSNGEISV